MLDYAKNIYPGYIGVTKCIVVEVDFYYLVYSL